MNQTLIIYLTVLSVLRKIYLLRQRMPGQQKTEVI